ncbi:MDR family MFS transporter [Clostridium weizhouense]|uniref:MFS transporter n=1 Tax=Clostridium weizhouense TaxID=2859781 RepID=A0ABS7AT72_9CLOT|nr:MDR family MFS transporter [Clostridium weizhouense]MBW6411283.1 MFS transporter [Clostridium weizhouense]
MHNKKRNIIIAIMVAMFLAAFEGTVVTTAMPTIAKSLHGYDLISLIFSSYLLTSAVSTPIYGKLSDLYGRKKMLSIGIVLFLIGSFLCGFSQSMVQLIIFRAIQGLGAGSILTITFTIVGDIFTLEERSKVQGCLSTVWGVSSLLGPFIGGFFIDYLSWHWIFFINIPFGIISILLLNKNLDEQVLNNNPKIDYLGSLFLTISIVSILLCLFTSSNLIRSLYIVCAIISLIIFYFIENKCEEPVVPFDIFSKDTVLINIISFFISAILMGIEAYTPLYTQNVLNYSAKISGVSMAPMSLTWLFSSFVLVKLFKKFGEKKVILSSILILGLTTILLRFITPDTPLIYLIFIVFIMGAGFGGSLNTLTILIQNDASYEKRGAATSTNALIRTLGQTIGVTIFGSLVNSSIVSYFTDLDISGVTADNIYSSGASSIQIKEAFFSGVHNMFYSLIFLTIICFIAGMFISKESKLT